MGSFLSIIIGIINFFIGAINVIATIAFFGSLVLLVVGPLLKRKNNFTKIAAFLGAGAAAVKFLNAILGNLIVSNLVYGIFFHRKFFFPSVVWETLFGLIAPALFLGLVMMRQKNKKRKIQPFVLFVPAAAFLLIGGIGAIVGFISALIAKVGFLSAFLSLLGQGIFSVLLPALVYAFAGMMMDKKMRGLIFKKKAPVAEAEIETETEEAVALEGEEVPEEEATVEQIEETPEA